MNKLTPFCKAFPSLACEEQWQFTPLFPGTPMSCYTVLEYYCSDPMCHCNTVQLVVANEQDPLASFCYGWKRKRFYRNHTLTGLPGLAVNPFGPQSSSTQALWKELEKRFLKHKTFTNMLKRHYKLVKELSQSRRVITIANGVLTH